MQFLIWYFVVGFLVGFVLFLSDLGCYYKYPYEAIEKRNRDLILVFLLGYIAWPIVIIFMCVILSPKIKRLFKAFCMKVHDVIGPV